MVFDPALSLLERLADCQTALGYLSEQSGSRPEAVLDQDGLRVLDRFRQRGDIDTGFTAGPLANGDGFQEKWDLGGEDCRCDELRADVGEEP